jgi:hypothetical protein
MGTCVGTQVFSRVQGFGLWALGSTVDTVDPPNEENLERRLSLSPSGSLALGLSGSTLALKLLMSALVFSLSLSSPLETNPA